MRLPSAIRRHLDVAIAGAQEALIDGHAEEALRLVSVVGEDWSFDEAVDYYFDELSITGPLASSIRNRALVRLEEERRLDTSRPSLLRQDTDAVEDEDGESMWRRLRPDRLVREIRERQHRSGETGRVAQLVLAQAEEAMLHVHVDNALDFVALLDDEMAPDRAVSYYVDAIGVSGCRAQAVVQRSMVHVADAVLKPHEPPRGGVTRRLAGRGA
ncbi:MAG TPA: hypothetical protein VMN78_10930 [Longimicrobiales bacterium]|nr:hypothetical protein [Longimicrobiales bacterium]